MPKILQRVAETKKNTHFMKLKEKLKHFEIIQKSLGLHNDQTEQNINPIDLNCFKTWDTCLNKLYQPDRETSAARPEYPAHEVQNIETDAISSVLTLLGLGRGCFFHLPCGFLSIAPKQQQIFSSNFVTFPENI